MRTHEEPAADVPRPATIGVSTMRLASRRAAARPENDSRQGAPEGRPRVALVAHAIHDRGGMERVCAELLRHLHADVRFVVVSTDLAPNLRALADRWVRIPVPQRPFALRFPAFFVAAGIALRRVHADLVHTVGAIVPNRADVAAVHYCHAGARAAGVRRTGPRASLRGVARALTRAEALAAERWCYRPSRVRRLAAVSAGTAAEVARHYPGVSVAVLPNGVDARRFAPDDDDRRLVRISEGVGDDLVALFVGSDWHRKGLRLAIAALADVRARGVGAALWIIGRGDRARFEELARQLGVTAAVRFLGERPDPERYYRAADVLVLPSAYEASPLVCFEAAASGLPLVVTSIPTADQLIGDDEAGVVVERTTRSVADALAMLADPLVRASRGAMARQRARRCTWDASAAATLDLYNHLLAGCDRSGA
jgi:glycosyltransferase involved in cell wall biosynthesis